MIPEISELQAQTDVFRKLMQSGVCPLAQLLEIFPVLALGDEVTSSAVSTYTGKNDIEWCVPTHPESLVDDLNSARFHLVLVLLEQEGFRPVEDSSYHNTVYRKPDTEGYAHSIIVDYEGKSIIGGKEVHMELKRLYDVADRAILVSKKALVLILPYLEGLVARVKQWTQVEGKVIEPPKEELNYR